MDLNVVILAAGKGTRMKSNLPKVLQPLAKKPLLAHVLETSKNIQAQKIIVVYGYGGDQVKETITAQFPDTPIEWVEQTEQLGTGHAVQQAAHLLETNSRTLILYGDVPLISEATLTRFLNEVQTGECGVVTVKLDNPTGYGRIVRDHAGVVSEIVEEKEAGTEIRKIQEVNTGIFLLDSIDVQEWLPKINNKNSQGEYYLTDIVKIANQHDVPVVGCRVKNPIEIEGVNDKSQLAKLERKYQRSIADDMLQKGATLVDPDRFDVRGTLEIGSDCFIDVNAVFEGNVKLGNNVQIEPNCLLIDCEIGDNTIVRANCVLESVKTADGCEIGPFARLRPGTNMLSGSSLGNFVETKNITLGKGSKAKHLTYLGDAEIGQKVNIGAGTIVCNYDGANKHKTLIGDGVFVGSNSALVAPINIGEQATVGAGSTVTKEVKANALTITRAKQITIDTWKRPVKKAEEITQPSSEPNREKEKSMCGIVGAVSTRDVTPILLEGLKRLEYRGYDSAGVARFNEGGEINRVRRLGKVKELEQAIEESDESGTIGVAHTRWATHGVPSEANAHPHMSKEQIAIVHNGIIENHEELRSSLQKDGYVFESETDTEVVAHLIHQKLQSGKSLLAAVKETTKKLRGAYALGVISLDNPDQIIAAREGSPLVLGVGLGENFIASDQLALLPVTTRFIFLEEGDIAEISRKNIRIENRDGETVERAVKAFTGGDSTADKGEYRHYMLKEIFEQPTAIRSTLEGRSSQAGIDVSVFGADAAEVFPKIETVQIIACGTSYHAGMVAKYWLEGIAGVQCNVEVASEFRYRKTVVRPNTLFVTISQSGETADTLAALRDAKGYLSTLTICNVPTSSLVRESAMSFMTKAGPEIGVASTKAFTTQLVALYLMMVAIGKYHDIDEEEEKRLLQGLQQLPDVVQSALRLNQPIEEMAELFAEKHHSLFLGRGIQFPIALEGALKLKEISYIHAEAYPAGELKHGPLALVDADMPVVTVAPSDTLLEKLKSNLQEVRARGGELFVFQDADAAMEKQDDVHVLDVPKVAAELAPIVYTIPLQLLSYHVAIIKGTDVDQPRNLAKSVTVE